TVGSLLLLLRSSEAALDRLRIVLSSLEQSAALLLPRRRLHEHEHPVRILLPHRERALHVHLEEHVVAGSEVLVDRRSRCALQVAVDIEPLEEPALVADALELASIEEQVVLAV